MTMVAFFFKSRSI